MIPYSDFRELVFEILSYSYIEDARTDSPYADISEVDMKNIYEYVKKYYILEPKPKEMEE